MRVSTTVSTMCLLLAIHALQADEPVSEDRRAAEREVQERIGTPKRSVCGHIRWGESGDVRLVVTRYAVANEAPATSIDVLVRNEGSIPFPLRPTDSWSLIPAEGGLVTLRPEKNKLSSVEPHEAVHVTLNLPKDRTAGEGVVFFRSEEIDREARIETIYVAPEPLRQVGAFYDPSLLEKGSTETVALTARVGTDGRVEKVFGPPVKQSVRVGASARALQQWVFSPPLENGAAVSSSYDVEFTFGDSSGYVAVVRADPATVEARLPAVLTRMVGTVVPVPSRHGYVAISRRREDDDTARVHAYFVRYGPGDTEGTTWITLHQKIRVSPSKPKKDCPCSWWTTNEAASTELPVVLVRALDTPLVGAGALTAEGSSLAPGAHVEDRDVGEWNLDPVLRVADELLAAPRRSKGPPAPPPTFPTEQDVLAASPATASTLPLAGVTDPVLLKKVAPGYPSTAQINSKQGKVFLKATIDEDGRVTDLEVLSSTAPVFEAAAAPAVCCWRYRPAMRNGSPVKVYFTVVVDFRLE